MIVMPHQEEWIGHVLSTSESFNQYAAACGGVARGNAFPIEKIRIQQEYVLALQVWSNLAKSRGTNALGQAFDNHFGFIDDAKPEAFADVVDGEHYIGMHTGLVRISFYLADELFLLRDVMMGYGAGVTDYNDRDLNLFPSPDALEESEALASEVITKVHPKRVAARDHFAHFLVMFGLFHEFNHAISGHSAFVVQRKGLGRLHENGSWAAEGMTSKLHQEIEYTADMGAIETMFDYIQRGAILRQLYRNAPRIPVQHRVFLSALAILCSLWHKMNLGFGSDGFHPVPEARWTACMRLYTIFLQTHYPFGRWALIGRAAARDLGLIASQCEDLLALINGASAYGEDADYWHQRSPNNLIIKLDDIRDLTYPSTTKRQPYRSRRLEALLNRAN
jgi:hypothetical protein